MMLERGEQPITGVQIRAARTLLGWSVRDLARRAAITIADVQEVENATKFPRRRRADAAAIRRVLEDAGIKFIDTVGVQLPPPGETGNQSGANAS